MIVSYNWLKELVKIDRTPEELVRDMSLYCVEVESLNKLVKASNIVIGHVLEVKEHENSDHLHVCKVNIGTEVSQIVCGAPNIALGQKVIVALPGCVLPGGVIKPSKVRGVESNGMICSLQELGIENKFVEAKYQNGIYVLNEDAPVGENPAKYLSLDDYQIELSLTPNRMDLMSMLGVMQDVSCMYKAPVLYTAPSFTETNVNTHDEIDVEIKTPLCLSYIARVVKDVKISESPNFIKARLIASGIRPINNVVDITNYVLMLFGQPLHSFDQDKLGSKIIVRNAQDSEQLVTLDDTLRTLKCSDIVISDNLDNNRAICLAGVMGGISTEITDTTTNVVLESAVFDPLTIRRTSGRLSLRSESSSRYERGVDLNRSLDAINYACYLLEKYASGKVSKGYVRKGLDKVIDKEISITPDFVRSYLGVNISKSEIIDICLRLGFTVTETKDELLVSVPNRRMDISIKQDLVEEIVRMYGYDKLLETLPMMNLEAEYTHSQKINNIINSSLKGMGLSEVITYSLVSPKNSDYFKILYNDEMSAITLLHPMTEEHSILRRSIVPSLLDVIKYNNARKISDLMIYELGKTFYMKDNTKYEEMHLAGALCGVCESLSWSNDYQKADFFYVKGILEELFTKLSLSVDYQKLSFVTSELHPGRAASILYNNDIIGFIGEVHPKLVSDYDIERTVVFEINLEKIYATNNSPIRFKQITKVPLVERDLALVMDKAMEVGSVIDAIKRCDKQMIKDVIVFDIYQGDNIEEGKKSVAVRIVLESLETLTDDIINQKVKKILNTLAFRFNIELRK